MGSKGMPGDGKQRNVKPAMDKETNELRARAPHKQFAGDEVPAKAAMHTASIKEGTEPRHNSGTSTDLPPPKESKGNGKWRDPLSHDAEMARSVEDRVREVAQKTIADEDPAQAAERLTRLAESELLHAELERASREKEQQGRVEAVKHPVETARRTGVKIADELIAKAERRLDALPAPVKQVGHLLERGAAMALWPARTGIRIAGEMLRTPAALLRILFSRRTA